MTEKAARQMAPLMEPEEAKKAMDAESALFVDVRRPDQFERLRIPGADLIPMKGSAEQLFSLPRNRTIIVY